MEVRNVLKSITNGEKNSGNNKETIDELKTRLKKQIDKLKSIILQIEWSLDVLKFGNTKCVIPTNTTINYLSINEVPDINVQLESQLYRYSGFYCVKMTNDEYVFNFSPSNKYDKKNTFAVQILYEQNKWTLGKWVMPIGIDLDDLISDFPVDELKNVPPFLRTCKHYVDSYFARYKQYSALMDIVSHTKYCNLQANPGYTQVSLNLTGLYDENTDSCINIIMYLLYDINEARPHKIEICLTTENELNESTEKQLQTSIEYFKRFDLHTAFENTLNMKLFQWIKEHDEDSPLEVNTLSGSEEEGFLSDLSLQKNRSLTFERARSKVEKKQRIRKKRKLVDISSMDKHSRRSVTLQDKKQKSQNVKQHSVRQQNISVTECTSNISNLKQKKLKQTKLKFQSNGSELQNGNNTACSSATVFKNEQINKLLDRPFTSTPVNRNEQHFSNFAASVDIDISDITVNKNDSNVAKTSKLKKDQFQSNTPLKSLRNKKKRRTK